jgi:hypothetical protein
MMEKEEKWKWEVESAAKTLTDAAKIKRKPKLHKAAISELKRQQRDIGRVIKSVTV